LLAAAQETGVIAALEQALPTGEQVAPRLTHTTPVTRRQSLLTLLFLGAVGLRRTWDLRGYTGDALALLTGRRRASGFWHTERFLSQVARAGGDEALTDALAKWTATIWLVKPQEPGQPPRVMYVYGHKKPVYTDHLIPRGLVGRFLLSLGLETNHGYTQRQVENSEVAKSRAVLERKLAKVQRQAQAARERRKRAEARFRKVEQQGVEAELAKYQYQERKRQAGDTIRAAFAACERACQQERDLLRQLEDQATSERPMYELDHAKDQVMTVLKLALANVVMWARDQYFPATYAQETWHRMAPFFRLPGRIVWGRDTVQIETQGYLRCASRCALNRRQRN
jgi:hypothetical protein